MADTGLNERKWKTLRRQYGIASDRIRQLKGDVARERVRFLERAEQERQHRVALLALLRAVLGDDIIHEKWLSDEVLERAVQQAHAMREQFEHVPDEPRRDWPTDII